MYTLLWGEIIRVRAIIRGSTVYENILSDVSETDL